MRAVRIPSSDVELDGDLEAPAGARGIVLFAHGSGSSRNSPRNRQVALMLRQGGLATVLMDLLTPEEDELDRQTAQLRFSVGLLAERVADATDWARQQDEVRSLPVGLFGASTGAAAALVAAAARPAVVRAVVSRGGRPDLAGDSLDRVDAPTLFIVGGEDREVIHLNKLAFDCMHSEKRLEIVPGATHLFEEPGALERVAVLAREWFQLHLAGRTMQARP